MGADRPSSILGTPTQFLTKNKKLPTGSFFTKLTVTCEAVSTAPVVQWIGHGPPKAEIEVQFLAGAQNEQSELCTPAADELLHLREELNVRACFVVLNKTARGRLDQKRVAASF